MPTAILIWGSAVKALVSSDGIGGGIGSRAKGGRGRSISSTGSSFRGT